MVWRFALAICISVLCAAWAGAAAAQTCAEAPATTTRASAIERISTLEQSTRAEPAFWDWVELGRLYHEAQRYPEARRAGEQALGLACDDRQRIAALTGLAETASAAGDADAAIMRYQQSLTLRRWQAETDTGAALKREIAANLDEMGALLLSRGDTARAGAALQESLDLRRGLLAGQRNSIELKREIATSLARMGELKFKEGDRAGAQTLLQESLETARAAAAADRTPASRRQVLASLILVGNVAEAQDDRARAKQVYLEALETARRVAAATPGDSAPQRDMALLLEHIGDVTLADGEPVQARARYQESLNLRRLLAAADGGTELVRDVAASLDKVGDALVAEGDLVAARANYEEALSIRRGLSVREPSLVMRDLYVSQQKIGDVAVHQGDYEGARGAYRESLGLARRAAAARPDAASNHDVWVAMWKLAELSGGVGWAQVAATMAEMQARGALPAADATFLQQARQRAR